MGRPVLEVQVPGGLVRVVLDAPGNIPEVVNERVKASVLVQQHVALIGDKGVPGGPAQAGIPPSCGGSPSTPGGCERPRCAGSGRRRPRGAARQPGIVKRVPAV